jgi:SAM-dependent methyltransferase
MSDEMDKQLDRIRKAYDLTVHQYESGIDPLNGVPDDLRLDPDFQTFVEEAGDACHGGAPDVRAYLNPGPEMRFLDVGCAAGLKTHHLHEWASTYYGVDISPLLIDAMKRFVSKNAVDVGGLYVADAADLPFEDDYFDIAAMVGVLEYYTLDYVEASLLELSRVLRDGAKMVVDIPNLTHPHVDMMFCLEECLSRPQVSHERSAFEELLLRQFEIDTIDSSRVMLKYFCRSR